MSRSLIIRRLQGVFSGVLNMYSFDQRMKSAVDDSGTRGWLVAILELGAWLGVLATGYLADKLSRKYTIVLGECSFVVALGGACEPASP